MCKPLCVARGLSALALVLLSLSQVAAAQEHFIGEIRWVPYTFAPNGWAECNGQLLPIAQNQALFSLLGTFYGGNGRVAFALPDMRGRVPLHVGLGPGLSNRWLGEAGGAETHALTVDELPAHSHGVASHSHAIPALPLDLKASSGGASSTSPGGNVLATVTSQGNAKGTTRIYAGSAADVSLGPSGTTAPSTTGSAGGVTETAGADAAHPNLPPYLGVRCIIALFGLFPQRP